MTRKRKDQTSPAPGPSRPTKLRRSARNAATTPATIPGPSAAADTVETTSESPNNPDADDTPHDFETPTTDASMAEGTYADAHFSVLEEVDGAPPAWADDRPSLACTIPWFNSTQAGMYFKDEYCWGLLIDGDCGARSYIDDEVVITRLGGGSEKVEGQLVVKKDQGENDLRVKCIMKSKTNKQEIGLVIGNRNSLLNRKLPHRFSVMDYFQIAKVWPEKQDGCVFYKVRFEKLDISKKSWWARKGAPDPVPHEQRTMQPVVKVCPSCETREMQVYKEGWTCLNRHCGDFWKINGHDITNAMNLTFHDAFLEYRIPPLECQRNAPSLVPDRLSEITKKEAEDPHFSFSHEAMRGIVCRLCCRCIPRRFWEGWKCADGLANQGASTAVSTTNKCPFKRWLNIVPLSLDEAIGPGSPKARRDSSAGSDYLQNKTSNTLHAPYTIHTYEVEGAGYIVHFVANKEINERHGGPNDLFKELQETKLGLRRFPLTQAVVQGTLQAQFAVNYGLPYKFVVPSESLAFNVACDAIHRVLGRLTWATQSAVASMKDTTEDPNELLVLGYQEGQKIGYHDDGEDSLGPTIASLSLGAPSTMKIRMKYKYYHGFTKTSHKLLDIDPVLPKCENYKKRLELKTNFYNPPGTEYKGPPETKEGYEKWRVERYSKEKNPKEKHQKCVDKYKEAWWASYQSIPQKERRESPPDLIKMELNHGDMVVMHGAKLQQYFEHAVDVKDTGKLRFALTARRIKREKVDEKDWPKGNFHLTGDQVYNGG